MHPFKQNRSSPFLQFPWLLMAPITINFIRGPNPEVAYRGSIFTMLNLKLLFF